MKTILFYRPDSEHAQVVEEYVREFKQRTGKALPTMNVDSREGMTLCELHDVVRYPTILVTDDAGREVSRWDGDMLPQISEVSYYVQG